MSTIPTTEPDGNFRTFQHWVNHATSYIGGQNALCVDTKDRICRNGADFMRARDEDAFPVRYYFGAGPETLVQQLRSAVRAEKRLRFY